MEPRKKQRPAANRSGKNTPKLVFATVPAVSGRSSPVGARAGSPIGASSPRSKLVTDSKMLPRSPPSVPSHSPAHKLVPVNVSGRSPPVGANAYSSTGALSCGKPAAGMRPRSLLSLPARSPSLAQTVKSAGRSPPVGRPVIRAADHAASAHGGSKSLALGPCDTTRQQANAVITYAPTMISVSAHDELAHGVLPLPRQHAAGVAEASRKAQSMQPPVARTSALPPAGAGTSALPTAAVAKTSAPIFGATLTLAGAPSAGATQTSAPSAGATRTSAPPPAARAGTSALQTAVAARTSAAPACALPTTEIAALGLPPDLVEAYLRMGLSKLYDWQGRVLGKWREGSANRLLCVSTSGGKSLVAELLMFVRLERFRATSALPPPAGFEARAVRPPPPRACLALIVLPLVTLAREWHLRLQRLTKGVEGFYQHHGSLPLGPYVRIAVCTIERAVGLVRSLEEEGRLAELVTVVVDEIHLVTEASRGPRLELLMSKLLYVAARSQGRLQLLGMSATVPNIELFARWLRAELHHESCRPQKLGVCVAFPSAPGRMSVVSVERLHAELQQLPLDPDIAPAPKGKGSDEGPRLAATAALCAHLRQVSCAGVSILVFCRTKARTLEAAKAVVRAGGGKADRCHEVLTCADGWLREAVQVCDNAASDEYRAIWTLLDEARTRGIRDNADDAPSHLGRMLPLLARGVAYHHGDLKSLERELVEALFRRGAIHTICSTSTLAAGVNLPVDCVVIDGLQDGMSQALSAASLQQMIGRAGRGPPRAVSSSQGGSTLPLVGAYLAVSSRAEVGAAHTLHASKIADTGSALRGQLDLLTLFALKSQLARTVGQVEDFVGHSLFAQHFKGDVAQATRAMIRRLAAAGLLECGANEALTLRLRGEGYVAMELGVAGGLKFEERLSADLRPGLFLSSLVHPLLAFAAPGDTLSTAWSEIVRGIQLSGDPELRHLMSSLGVVGQCEITSGNIAALTKEPGDELKRRLLEALALNAMLVTQHDKASATAARAIGQEGMRKLLRDADLRCGNVCQFLKSMRRHQEYALAAKLKEMLHAALSADESSLIELRLICSLTDAQLLRKAGFSTIEQVATDQRVGSNCGKRGKGGAVAAAISKSRHGRIADWTTAARTCDRSKQAIVRTAMIIVKSARRLLGQRLQGHQRTLKAAKKAVATAARPRAARRKPTQTQAVARHMDNDLLSLCTEASSPQHVAGLDRVDVASGAAGAARAGAQQPPPVSLADFSAAVAAMASSGGIAFCVHSHKSRSSAAGGSAHEVLGVAVAGYAGTSTSQAASCAVRVFYVPLDAKQHGAQKRSREANDGDAQAQLRAAWAAVAGALLDSAGPCAAHNAKSQLALFADAARRATGEIIFARGKLRSVADPSVLALLLRGHEADAQQLFAMARQLGLVDETATHRQLAPTDAACFQAVLTLSVAAKLREDLARCPGPAPVASVQPKPPCSALIEEQMPAVLARMELEGIAIHTTVLARLHAQLMWTADALEEQASRECGRRIDLRCCAEVTQALAAQKADASEGQAEKANLPVLVRLAAEGNLLAAIALARRRLVELLMHYYKLRKNAVPEGPGLHVCFTRISESSCVSGRMYYEESGRMVSPLALPKNDILVRSPALAASSRSIAAHCAAGVPPAGKAHVAVLDRTFSREQAAAATAAKAETEEQLNCTPPPSGSLGGSESDFALPTGVHLATIERMLPCSVAQCIVRVNGAACTLEAHWGYSRHQAENTPVVLLAVGASLRAEPALGEHIEADGAISGALRPYPADRVFLVSKYVAFDGSESGNATLDEAARARFACTHPPAGALVLRPSRLLRFNLRDCVRARPGCMLVCVDYKNAELAIAASMSGDHNLCSALDAGDDPFRLIARQLRRKGKDLPIGDEERARAKQMFYAVLYGGGSPKVEQRFFECFPGVQALIDALRAKGAEEGGAVHTVAGRRRVFTAEERKDARLFRRRALNAVCQGSVADLLKISMVANNGLEARLQQTVAPSVRVRLLMQLHDELVYEVGPAALPTFRSSSDHASERDPAEDILRVAIAGISEGMTEAGRSVGLRVPLRTTVKVGATWGSAQPLVP